MRLLKYLRRGRRDEDAAREIASYIAIETDDNIARGMSPQAAHDAAVRKFGNATRVREEIYWMNTLRPIDTIWQDLKFAMRLLQRDKGFALAAILSLGLGIGANTAIFQLLDAVRLRSLPVERPEELAEVLFPPGTSRRGAFTGRRPNLTYPLFDEIRRRQQVFSGVFAWGVSRFNTAVGGEVRRIEGLWASGEMFSVLGLKPAIGRFYTPDEDRPGCGSPGAVLSYAYWQREFGGAPSALQQTVRLERVTFDIIGVAPPDFFGLDVGRRFDVAIPLCADRLIQGDGEGRQSKRDWWWLAAIGRLAPGRTVEQAADHLASLSPDMALATLPPDFPGDDERLYKEAKLTAMPASSGVSGIRQQFGEPLTVLLGATGLVLLIACANLANLLLARASAREREMAVRLAIGAARRRLVAQLLVESILLAVAGTLLGVLVARGLTTILIAQLSAGLGTVFIDLTWNPQMLAFTAAVTAIACVLFGLAPALKATALSPALALRAGGRGLTMSRERFGVRRLLVVTQVALSLVLLLGALLFSRTLYNLLHIDTGFDRRVLVAFLSDESLAGDVDRGRLIRDDIRARLAAIPGVEQVAQTDYVPLGGSYSNDSVYVELLSGQMSDKVLANFSSVGQDYFRILHVPIVRGRDFDERDTRQSPPVAIVNETFVRKALNGADPIGRVIRVESAPNVPARSWQIVGVSGDAKHTDLRDDFEPVVVLPATQTTEAGDWVRFIIRSRGDTDRIVPAVVQKVAEVNSSIDIEFSVLSDTIRNTLVRERLMAALSAAFGLLAGLLAAVGLYGVMSYTVSRRSNEIGIRLAMGARAVDVLKMVIAEAGWLVGIGVAIGVGLGLGAAKAASALLFGLRPTDPVTLASAMALLIFIGLLASYLPARRASKLDPMTTLRQE
ncbi:MAG TPA: ABC transporter permease [Vicinamibacterales bacterium]|nr:ABC transporter permease [Vicinamibacterales bacterium]